MSTRKIQVIACEPFRTGTGAKGEWTLYKVTAVDMAGAPIELELKSFSKLEGDVEVEVEKQVHEKYGESYLLKLPRGAGGGGGAGQSAGARLGPKVDELRGRVEHLETQVEWLRSELGGLRTLVQQLAREGQGPGGPVPPVAAGHGAAQGSTFGGDDDIPF